MNPTPPSISSSTGSGHSPEGQYRVVRKRNRVPLSCAPCRSRKLKCNRAMPCENCVKRGDGSSCTYAQAAGRKRNQSRQNSPTTPVDMQNRIDRLEGLVLSLMTNGSQSSGPAAAMATVSAGGSTDSMQDADGEDVNTLDEESDTDQVTRSFGIMKFDSKSQKTYYISEAHWASILHDISEVKQFFANSHAQYEEQTQIVESRKDNKQKERSALIFGISKPASESEIMASFPSKYTADILVSRYLSIPWDPFRSVIHCPTFRKQYAAHWQDPSKSSIVWIGMVFAIMRLAMLSYYREDDEPVEFRGKSLDIATTYRNSMAQCLVLADYTKPHRYLIETMLLHLQAEYTQHRDTETSVWVLDGVIVRLAMRMGYHRDSKMFPNISAFEGEMRRRRWTLIRQLDYLFSFQVALPHMIRGGDSDTDMPHNLSDDDFAEDSIELPSERPSDELTPVSYLIAKTRIATAFGRVLEFSQKFKGTSYDEVMEIDRELRRASDMVPNNLRVRPMSECQKDPAYLIMTRFQVMSVYHKAQCVLHRRFLDHARDNPRYMTSRRTCVESALELLQYQAMLHAESRPGGLLSGKKWHTSSLSSHDFLLAGTIISLDLYHDCQMRASGAASGNTYGWGFNREQEMIAALCKSRDIWSELKDEWMEAWKATCILTVLIEKVNQGSQAKEAQKTDNQDEKQNAAMTLGLLSSGMTPVGLSSPPYQFTDSTMKFDPNAPSQVNLNPLDQTTFPQSPLGMFGQMPDMQPFNLDWDAWDNYIQSGGIDPASQNWSTVDLQQLQQLPQSPIATNRAENVTTAGERVTYPATSAQPSIFDNGAMNIPGGNVFRDPNIDTRRRPGQM